MEKEKFNFWKDHSVNYLKMAFQHDQRQKLENPDGYGRNNGECGDTVEMFLSIRKGRVQSVCFNIDGCINTNACCNTVAYLAEGKPFEEAWGITAENIINYLGTLPPGNYHCAELAVGALYKALSNYQQNQRDPWRKRCQKK
ncbi:MAG: iron-sulfur cluster assembly scaffold protein [Desulfobacterales bacterium]|jgi:nitrogen fixation NifU-like protein